NPGPAPPENKGALPRGRAGGGLKAEGGGGETAGSARSFRASERPLQKLDLRQQRDDRVAGALGVGLVVVDLAGGDDLAVGGDEVEVVAALARRLELVGLGLDAVLGDREGAVEGGGLAGVALRGEDDGAVLGAQLEEVAAIGGLEDDEATAAAGGAQGQ